MITIRKSEDRGHFDHGWLNTYHTFSFADYHDPAHMGFSVLRVINDDQVIAGEGFDTHPHRDMEIVTYVLQGALAHQDSMGNGSTIRPGDVQRMTAGTGITHSEFNASKTEKVHLLQIWITPEATGLKPGYEQKAFSASEKKGQLRLVASRDGREGSVVIHQDANVFAALLGAGTELKYQNRPARRAWLQVAQGSLRLNGRELKQGDGAAITGGEELTLSGLPGAGQSEILLFDLP